MKKRPAWLSDNFYLFWLADIERARQGFFGTVRGRLSPCYKFMIDVAGRRLLVRISPGLPILSCYFTIRLLSIRSNQSSSPFSSAFKGVEKNIKEGPSNKNVVKSVWRLTVDTPLRPEQTLDKSSAEFSLSFFLLCFQFYFSFFLFSSSKKSWKNGLCLHSVSFYDRQFRPLSSILPLFWNTADDVGKVWETKKSSTINLFFFSRSCPQVCFVFILSNFYSES